MAEIHAWPLYRGLRVVQLLSDGITLLTECYYSNLHVFIIARLEGKLLKMRLKVRWKRKKKFKTQSHPGCSYLNVFPKPSHSVILWFYDMIQKTQ